MPGKEIIQLYIKDVESNVIRPEKELKGFKKVKLLPAEEKEVTFTLDERAFAYYNIDTRGWHTECGEFVILVGKSSRDIVLRDTVYVKSPVPMKNIHRNSTVGDVMENPAASEILKSAIQKLVQMHPHFRVAEGDAMETFTEMMRYMPLRNLVSFSSGAITEEMLENLIKKMNLEHK